MKQERLAELIESPELHRKILGNYKGAYSLGLTLNPENRRELAIRVRLEGDDPSGVPSHIILDGESIPIIVNQGFKKPEPLVHSSRQMA